MTTKLHAYLKAHGLSLETSSDPTVGRKVMTTQDHKRGEVLVTSQPLGAVPLGSQRHEICNYCFRKAKQQTTLQRCSQCKAAYFCDMGCFKNAWLTYHQFACKKTTHIPELIDLDQDAMDLEMLERVAVNYNRYEKRKQSLQSERASNQKNQSVKPQQLLANPAEECVDITMEAFNSLMDHLPDQPRQNLTRYERLAIQALAKPHLSSSGLTKDDLVRFLCRFQCNNFGIHDDYLFSVGEGTYPVASLINHSCRPNAIATFSGAMMSILAIDHIQAGQEVTIAYLDIAHDRSHRLSSLWEKYFFHCKCVRCVTVDASINTPDTVLGNIDAFIGNEDRPDWWALAETLLQSDGEGLSISAKGKASTTPTPSSHKDTLWKQIEDAVSDENWDMPALSAHYDRYKGNVPDISKPLTLAEYTHTALTTTCPYIWTVEDLSLHGKLAQLGSNYRSPAPLDLPTPPTQGIRTFDDPIPEMTRPKLPDTYLDLLAQRMTSTQAYPTDPDSFDPRSLAILPTATKVYFNLMARGEWQIATKLGLYVASQYILIYPPYHPVISLHFLILAKCCWNTMVKEQIVGKNLINVYQRSVRRWILVAKITIAVTAGKKGSQWREIGELEWIFSRDQKLLE